MPQSPRNYQTLAEFEREEIRPSFKIGFSIDDFEETSFEAESEVGVGEFHLDSVDETDEEEDDDDASDDDA
ncbi:MAG TPA: transcriptional regulator [Polyangiaceae bacterium]|jgi:hypothetical protein|nr:transcriptional regulator [Polyangiaceae bacterium]